MRLNVLPFAIAVMLGSFARAETNTPYPVGKRVSVTTSAGTVTGLLQDVFPQQWIGVLEAGANDITFIRGTDVIVRTLPELAPRAIPRSAAAVATTLPRMMRAGDLEELGAAGHYVHGRPRATDDRFTFTPKGFSEPVEGITFHVREAFTIGHYNRMKVPAWIAMRWTTNDLMRSEEVDLERGDFVPDIELPLYARTSKDLDFLSTKLERGHMARDADLEAWGFDAVREGMRMSNICPQRQGRNHKVWEKLEDQHRFIVRDPDVSGIGTVFGSFQAPSSTTMMTMGRLRKAKSYV